MEVIKKSQSSYYSFSYGDRCPSYHVEFISDYALVLAQLDSVNPPLHKTNVATFRRHHKIDLDSLLKDLGNCSFIRRPGDTVSVLCEQYLDDLSKLLDKHAPLVTHTFTAYKVFRTPLLVLLQITESMLMSHPS